MQLEMKEIEELAEKLNLTKEEMVRESLKLFLERKLREIKTEIFSIRSKYGVASVEAFEEKYKKGEIDEKDTWQDLQKLDHLEFKKDELEKAFRAL